jgi:hypothetical protein
MRVDRRKMGPVIRRRGKRDSQDEFNANERERTTMNTKQRLATGFLAMVIVASVAFMPVNAEVKDNFKARRSGMILTPLNTAELPHEQVRDLTYN